MKELYDLFIKIIIFLLENESFFTRNSTEKKLYSYHSTIHSINNLTIKQLVLDFSTENWFIIDETYIFIKKTKLNNRNTYETWIFEIGGVDRSIMSFETVPINIYEKVKDHLLFNRYALKTSQSAEYWTKELTKVEDKLLQLKLLYS